MHEGKVGDHWHSYNGDYVPIMMRAFGTYQFPLGYVILVCIFCKAGSTVQGPRRRQMSSRSSVCVFAHSPFSLVKRLAIACFRHRKLFGLLMDTL